MKHILLLFTAMALSVMVHGQVTVNVFVNDSETKQPIAGATIVLSQSAKSMIADKDGKATITDLPAGSVRFIISAAGYEKLIQNIVIPLEDTSVIFYLPHTHHEMEEIVIASTRTGRTIGNVPTRVEVIDLEEIEEKINMRPSNVSMILHESTGILMQQTSPTSANASIRIQGLDGRYTQLLKDGYANFGNFASGLSVLEIPPLDLAQVELIKGPASTLFGGGAIAGVVNFISKMPKVTPEYSFIASQSHVGQTTLGAFASARGKKSGYTFLALGNLQQPYDVDKDAFTELARSRDFTLHPKLFFYPDENSYWLIGNSFTTGSRTGGDMSVVKGKSDVGHTYFETNQSLRNTTTIEFDKKPDDATHLSAKTSFSYFNRDILMHQYRFSGVNYNSFTDLTYAKNTEHNNLVLGLNLVWGQFREKDPSIKKRNFNTHTAGVYAQNTSNVSELIQVEAGLRIDAVNYKNNLYSKAEVFLLPRVSALFHISEKFTSRIGGGLGYKAPSLFTEAAESMQYQNVQPLNGVRVERSYGGTADINYKTYFGDDFNFSFNHMFFYTRIRHALLLVNSGETEFSFMNTDQPVHSKGFETNVKVIFRNFIKLFAGYTFTNAKAEYLPGNQFIPLVAKNRVNMVLMYEKGTIKAGLEGYFSDWQYLTDGSRSPSFWDLGALAEKRFGKVSIFINAENFLDARQSRIRSVVNGPRTNPVFDDVWSYHPEGRVLSAGLKLKL